MKRDTRKVALVTGASFGIGQALVQELIEQEYIVLGLARNVEKLQILQNQMGKSFIPIVCDVSSILDIRKAQHNILNKNLCPSVFFLNAGLAGEKFIEN